jgi:hypothetical protein
MVDLDPAGSELLVDEPRGGGQDRTARGHADAVHVDLLVVRVVAAVGRQLDPRAARERQAQVGPRDHGLGRVRCLERRLERGLLGRHLARALGLSRRGAGPGDEHGEPAEEGRGGG